MIIETRITYVLARDLDRRDTLAGDVLPLASVLTTDLGVSVGVQGEISNRLHYLPTDRVPVRAGCYEALKLRGNYPGPVPQKGTTVDVRC